MTSRFRSLSMGIITFIGFFVTYFHLATEFYNKKP